MIEKGVNKKPGGNREASKDEAANPNEEGGKYV